jgi:hypothetical protein
MLTVVRRAAGVEKKLEKMVATRYGNGHSTPEAQSYSFDHVIYIL